MDYSATLTPDSGHYGYGAGFWTNRGGSAGAKLRIGEGMPGEAFMARGSYGQYIIIVPSERLVIARFGFSYSPRADMGVVDRLVADVMAALRGRGA